MPRINGPTDQLTRDTSASCLNEIAALACGIRGIKIDIRPETRIAQHIGLLHLPGFWGAVHEMCPKRIPRIVSADLQRYVDSLICTKWAILTLLMAGGITYALAIVSVEYSRIAGAIFYYFHPLDIHLICIYTTFHVVGVLFPFFLMARVLLPLAFGSLRYQFGRLPHGISTFGELAALVSGDRGGWCLVCGYDMTGIAERCPECWRENAAS